MRKFFKFDIFFGFILIAILSVITVLLLYFSISLVFKDLDKNVQSTIIAAGATVFASVGAVIYNQRRTKERDISEAQRPQKIKVYKNFMEFLAEILVVTRFAVVF